MPVKLAPEFSLIRFGRTRPWVLGLAVATPVLGSLFYAVGYAMGQENPPKVSSGAKPVPRTAKLARIPVPLSCSISSLKSTYKMGEAPAIRVRIRNESDQAVYLVGSLDGSEAGMRYPHCGFEIRDSTGQLVEPRYARCGNTNPLRPADFVRVAPRSVFDPYMEIDYGGFFGSYLLTLGRKTFSKPGRYKLRFHYSSANPKLEDWLGDGKLGQDRGRDQKLTDLLRKVPKLDIESNELEVAFVS